MNCTSFRRPKRIAAYAVLLTMVLLPCLAAPAMAELQLSKRTASTRASGGMIAARAFALAALLFAGTHTTAVVSEIGAMRDHGDAMRATQAQIAETTLSQGALRSLIELDSCKIDVSAHQLQQRFGPNHDAKAVQLSQGKLDPHGILAAMGTRPEAVSAGSTHKGQPCDTPPAFKQWLATATQTDIEGTVAELKSRMRQSAVRIQKSEAALTRLAADKKTLRANLRVHAQNMIKSSKHAVLTSLLAAGAFMVSRPRRRARPAR